jgi:hypothetical protein
MSIEGHEEFEQLLAGYALQSLDGEDAERADRLLAEHLPTCAACRATLADFGRITGDLALAVPSLTPPDTLLPRLHHEIGASPAETGPGRRNLPVLTAAASLVAVVAMVGLTISFGNRASTAEDRQSFLSRVFTASSTAGRTPVALDGNEGVPDEAMHEVSGPQLERIFIYGNDVPPPAPGNVYCVWLGRDGRWTLYGPFVPDDDGWVGLELVVDTSSAYDAIWVSEEPADAIPAQPQQWRWSTGLP